MARVPRFYHPAYDAEMPAGHRFPMSKFRRLAEVLADKGMAPFAEPEPARREDLIRAHASDYVDAVLGMTLDAAAVRRIGLPVTASVVARARAATGGTIAAARAALQAGLAGNLAGGSHHAGPDFGAGFCIFNDVAVAARVLLDEGAVSRVLVVDADVHHGDGTALIFAEDPRVFTLSVHCEANFPTRKPPSDLDVGLPRGAGDADYLTALGAALDEALVRARPDIVFYNAGVDPHTDDALGLLDLSDDGLARREELVLSATHGRGLATTVVIGGGYGPDVDVIARRHALVHEAMESRA